MRNSIATLALLATAATAQADFFDCSNTAARAVAHPAAGIRRVVINGESGTLRVTGRPGATEIRATGTACASDKDFLGSIVLKATRNGDELRIDAEVPEKVVVFGWWEAKLDFEVALPANVHVVVRDGSGRADIHNVASAEIVDGSGALEIRGVRGNLEVRDGSGEIDIADVTGDVKIEDGSGAIEIERVGGTVLIDDDGSGGLSIRNVRRNVTIDDKGSGGVDVSDVGGDFIVHSKGSGGVNYDRVAGRVSVPRRR